MTTGKPEWFDNPTFSEAIWLQAGLKTKPEKEDRGVHVAICANWTGEVFRENAQACVSSGPAMFFFPASIRLAKLILERLTPEIRGYRFIPFTSVLHTFVAQPDRRVYMKGIEAPQAPSIHPDGLEVRCLPGIFANARPEVEHHLRQIDKQLKQLKGWGYI